MSSISAGVGLISGLPINDLVESMLAAQQQPIKLLKARFTALDEKRTALLKISANLLAILNSAARFKDPAFFQTAKAASSDEKSVLATAAAGAPAGQFQLTVRRLAAAHQVISKGFATSDATPVGAGVLTIESVRALLNKSDRLANLRGGAGVQRGKFKITDRAGNSTIIDLVPAVTINDVVGAINGQAQAGVKARVQGDHLVLTDQTGLAAGSLTVSEVGAGSSAVQLGILGSSASGIITGENLLAISESTRIDELNDGNGVRRRVGAPDFSVSLADGSALNVSISDRIGLDTPLALLNSGGGVPAGSIRVKTRAGIQRVIDLSSATTIADVKNAIETAGAGLTVTLSHSGLTIIDHSVGSKPFVVEDPASFGTARALGIVGSSTGGEISGKKIFIVDSVGDLIRLINANPNNNGKLTASISSDGLGLALTDTTSGAGTLQVTALNGSSAAEDLGILTPTSGNVVTSRRWVAGLNTVLLRSLNGGAGAHPGVIQLTDRSGAGATVDLTNAQSLADVIEAINRAGTGVRAAVSANGLGLQVTDTSGGTGNLRIADLTGSLAGDLHIAVDSPTNSAATGNLQRQYISAATALATLRNGAGVPPGKFRITNSTGASAVVDLTQGNETRLQDVIDEINSRGIGVSAGINASGDGLILTDTAGGAGRLRVAEEGGTTAKALGILGEAAAGQTTIDGSFEYKITLTGSDSLQDLLTKIKAAGIPATATILRDPSSSRPYRLTLTSNVSGLDGALTIDAGTTGLALTNLVDARDAAVVLGPSDADAPLVLNSSSNTLSDAVPNVRLDLTGASPSPVTISVTPDPDAIVRSVNLFVSAFNTAIESIETLTRFDDKTNERSPLTGDPTIRNIRQRLIDLATRVVPGLSAPFNRLSAIGIELVNGNSLQLNENRVRQALANHPSDVQTLFTDKDRGVGFTIESELKRLTDTGTGVISVQDDSIKSSQDLLTRRIDQLNVLLGSRRERLLAQFQATESVLSQLRGQQSALSSLGPISLGLSTSR